MTTSKANTNTIDRDQETDRIREQAVLDATELAARVSAGHRLTAAEALAVVGTPDEATLALIAAAGTLRRKHFGNTVKVNYLVNLKSGLCPEDCTYCSQRLGSKAEILKYTWLKSEEAVRQAGLGVAGEHRASAWSPQARAPQTGTWTGWPQWSSSSRTSTHRLKFAPA